MSVKPNFGGKDLPFVFKGDKIVYPNPVKDGLVLWYDFAGMRNTDLNREIAKDLSDNGNHGTLQNFNFTEQSGYGKNRLLFDGVDDYVGGSDGSVATDMLGINTIHDTISFTVKVNESKRNNLLYAGEILKIDAYGDNVRRADVSPNLTINHDMMTKPVSISYVRYDGGIKVYIDGELVSDTPYENEDFKELQLYSIGNYISDSRPNVELYDVKIYSRPLTAEEIAHNYAIEKERFGIE